MIPMDKALDNIKKAKYGEEVRMSIHDAIHQMDQNANEAVSVAITSQSSSKVNADIAENSAKEAKDAAAQAQAVVGIDIATTTKAGLVRPDGMTINVEPDGKISVPDATSTTPGLVRPDGTTTQVENGVIKVIGGGGGGVSGGSVLHVHTRDFIGFDVTVTDSDPDTGEIETQTAKFDNNGIATFHVVGSGAATISVEDTDGTIYTASVNMTYYGIYTASINRFSATINVSVVAGATVTVTDGVNTYSALSVGGTATLQIGSVGSFTISASIDGVTSGDTKTVSITSSGEVKTTSIAFATVTITFDGSLIGTITNGAYTQSITDASGRITVYVPSIAEYTISGTLDGEVFNDTKVNVTGYSNFTVEITLKDFFVDWLTEGRITTQYATLEDLLTEGTQNEKDVRQLMTIHASCDKLVEWYNDSTSDFPLSTFMNSRIAMKWIGLRDYICDKLMAIAEVKTALLGSTHWEYILKDKVPVMTSDTAPEGEVKSGSVYNSSTYAYKAFDGIDYLNGDWWASGINNTNRWLQYKFPRPVKANRFRLYSDNVNQYNMDITSDVNVVVKASNDGFIDDIHELGTFVWKYEDNKRDLLEYVNNDGYYLYYRVEIDGFTVRNSSESWVNVSELQFYGRNAFDVSIPSMTSLTEPYGVASGESLQAQYDGKWVDGNWAFWQKSYNDASNNRFYTDLRVDGYVQYSFPKPIIPKAFTLTNNNDGAQYYVDRFEIQASKDNSVWVSLGTFENHSGAWHSELWELDNPNNEIYQHFRFYNRDRRGSASIGSRANIFGYEYSELEFEQGSTRKYLYDNGVVFEETNTRGIVTYDNDTFTIGDGVSTTSEYPCVTTKNKINLSSYNLVGCKLSNSYSSATSTISIGVDDTSPCGNTGGDWTAFNDVITRMVNKYSDNQYCKIGIQDELYPMLAYGGSGDVIKVEVAEWWLE